MDLASLRAQQIELASSVIREDRLDKDPPDLIAGADVGPIPHKPHPLTRWER